MRAILVNDWSETSELSELRELSERSDKAQTKWMKWTKWTSVVEWVNKGATLRDETEKSYLIVEWAAWNHFLITYRAAFVGRFDNNVLPFPEIFKRRPLFGRKVGKFSVAIEFEFLNVMTAFFDEKI